MSQPRVLIACEASGVVRQELRRVGIDAWSCDLRPAEDNSVFHLTGDVFDALAEGWDGLIAHPPCTYLSASGMHWTTRGLRPQAWTDDAVDFARRLLEAPVRCVAMENPVGVLSTRLRKPDQIIQPNQFGHDASKRTCLWLRNLPRLTPTQLVPGRMVNGRERWGNQTDSGQNRLAPSPDRWRLRSRTYEGIARAMAEQWGPAFKGDEAMREVAR